MGTKREPGAYDCHGAALDDEPLFTLLARDPLAPVLVEAWASLREHLAGNPSKVAEARQVARAMRAWRGANVSAGGASAGGVRPGEQATPDQSEGNDEVALLRGLEALVRHGADSVVPVQLAAIARERGDEPACRRPGGILLADGDLSEGDEL